MKKLTVSVICTNYNKGSWIGDAIESFLSQECDFDYEILIIDDASSDISRKIIKDYAKKYPEIIRAYYNEKNLGITKTWIKICKEAKGKYIARCDGDDFWIDKRKLQKQVELLSNSSDSLWCSTDYNIVSPDGELKHRSAFESGLVDRADSYASMLATKGFTMSSTWLVDTKLMQKINSRITNSAVDDTFNIQLDLFNNTKLSYIPEPTVVYRVNEGSDSRPVDMESILLRNRRLLNTQLEYINRYKDKDYKQIIELLLERSMKYEMWATERMSIIDSQKELIQKQDNHIKELDKILQDIINSHSYKIGTKATGLGRSVVKAPSRVSNRIKRGVAEHRYLSYRNLDVGNILEDREISIGSFTHKPLISIIVPTYNTPGQLFREMSQSLMSQIYPNLEIIFIDDASTDKTVRNLIKGLADKDDRVKYKFLDSNQHISAATNHGIDMASGEFIALMDHDDILHPSATLEVVKALNTNSEIDFIYTDEDKINERGKHVQPFFKPNWNPDLLLSVNYIMHFTVIRKSMIDKFGGENSAFDGAQDWELFLRLAGKLSSERIHHIPRILYSWRMSAGSTAKRVEEKSYVTEAQRKCLEMSAKTYEGTSLSILRDPEHFGQWNLSYKLSGKIRMLLVVLGKSNGGYSDVKELTIGTTEYKVIYAENGFRIDDILKYDIDYVAFAYNDSIVKDDSWSASMAGDAQREDVGIVLSKISDEGVMSNLGQLIGDKELDMVGAMNRANVSKRLYLSARYNINSVISMEGVVVTSAKKIHSIKSGAPKIVTIKDISDLYVSKGYRNLYNPYVRVLE